MKLKTMTMEWTGDELILIDQRKIPLQEEYMHCKTYEEVAYAIKEMIVRGAPAIGASAAFGYVLGARQMFDKDFDKFIENMKKVREVLANTRPTAVNLFWALDRMEKALIGFGKPQGLLEFLEEEALNIAKEDIEVNKAIGRYGAELLKDGDTVLTHCNAGALATVDYGTALGVIRAAVEQGKKIKVFADETRPYLQGARLTAWELMKDGIDVTLISDNMSGWSMKLGKINAVIVGADRVAANGDVANKIGTYMVAVLAKRHGIPFYVAAPTSTIDLNTKTGKDIPIEERKHTEVTHCGGKQIAPDNVKVFNPAFDVTDAELVTAIITEKGVVYPPYEKNLKKLFEE
ncbi:methylthioribose-1-phosphate isomerase [Thermosipho affectus]|uniref:Methylthioribose-1-phosphate isomerase n=1 Tax=Thermosipho affectus TaxID=660294 RepID=A0ABX3IJ30_9BACT|nr:MULTISPECIES: S-methyl-5-thioribose-1-phosphate isomerase [Thermosipho]ANQ53367.1 methylthioribose-1-phosphate isomerase [Thermosipho sp. 1070]APT71816.1 methylthioribose-1-phosphate isomerase [Thermosipho sp. 1063]ONN27831.1 methylthioribose-1-phosphate isomerase [Thermosipho affectus]OOC45322.1 methylthioribose-1-phosphate isomerase [Thermosipho sp. 1074]